MNEINNKKGEHRMNELSAKMYVKMDYLKEQVYDFLHNERGEANIIAIIIVIAIVVALAIVFRKNIKKLFDDIWVTIFGNVSKSTGTY